MNRALFGNEHTSVAENLSHLGTVLEREGRFELALQHYRESLSVFQRILGEKHPYSRVVIIHLARTLGESGKAAEAETLFRKVLGELDPAKEAQRAQYVEAQVGLGEALTDEGRPSEGLRFLEQASEMARTALSKDDLRTAATDLALGRCLMALRHYARAEPLLRDADAVFQKRSREQPLLAKEASAAVRSLVARARWPLLSAA